MVIGSRQLVVMAGPCSVESRDQLLEPAQTVKEAGTHVLCGGVFKPRTCPYSFQGLREKGLGLLNDRVMLCEHGIRTFEKYTRNTLDISAVPLLKQASHWPVIVDPSHGTGKWELVEPMSRAAVAAGADGLIIEVHPHPDQAFSDGAQSLKPARFAALMRSLRPVAAAVGRTLS